MAKLIYFTLMSLDGFIEDTDGSFHWAEPDQEVHQFANDLVRPAGTLLYGRRMYEVMQVWETEPSLAEDGSAYADFARVWQAADKVVYSRTLEAVATARTRLEREFDPAQVHALKAEAGADLYIAGPDLAAHAFRAGLVDECQLLVVPWLVGDGKRALPQDARRPLELLDYRRFTNGTTYLRYGVIPGEGHR